MVLPGNRGKSKRKFDNTGRLLPLFIWCNVQHGTTWKRSLMSRSFAQIDFQRKAVSKSTWQQSTWKQRWIILLVLVLVLKKYYNTWYYFSISIIILEKRPLVLVLPLILYPSKYCYWYYHQYFTHPSIGISIDVNTSPVQVLIL